MALTSRIAVLLVITFSFAVSAYSLQCYECNSSKKDGKKCENMGSNSKEFLKNCTAPANKSCSTLEQWVEFKVLNQQFEKRTIRQCSSAELAPEKSCYYRSGFGGKVNTCHCKDSACNKALSNLPFHAALLLGFALIFKITLPLI